MKKLEIEKLEIFSIIFYSFLKRTIFEEHCDSNLLKVSTSSEQRMAETNINFLQECVHVTRPTQKENKYFFKEH